MIKTIIDEIVFDDLIRLEHKFIDRAIREWKYRSDRCDVSYPEFIKIASAYHWIEYVTQN